jgi:hypothetical protein
MRAVFFLRLNKESEDGATPEENLITEQPYWYQLFVVFGKAGHCCKSTGPSNDYFLALARSCRLRILSAWPMLRLIRS